MDQKYQSAILLVQSIICICQFVSNIPTGIPFLLQYIKITIYHLLQDQHTLHKICPDSDHYPPRPHQVPIFHKFCYFPKHPHSTETHPYILQFKSNNQNNYDPPMEAELKQISTFRYATSDIIGKGFSSVVYKGLNLENNTPVALKVVDLNTIKTDVEQKLLNNEIKALRTLKHKNIVEVYEIYQADHLIYFVSEYCNQRDLLHYSKQKGKIQEEEMVRIVSQILAGLSHMFAHGIIHRDLKTANILLKDGNIKIGDFGFCGFSPELVQPQKYSVGSPLYMSPQAYKRNIYSSKSDLWALGIIIYELVIGEQPFRGYDYDSMIKTIAQGEIYKNVQSAFLRMLLSRLLTVELQRRPQISQMLTIMRTYQPASKINIMPSLATMEHNFKKKPNGNSPNHYIISQNGSSRKIMTEHPSSSKTQTQAFIQNRINNMNTSNVNPVIIPSHPHPQQPVQPKDYSAIYQFSTVARPQSSKPFLVSFDSNLSTFSNASIRYDMVGATDKLLLAKFVYRICKMFIQFKQSYRYIKRVYLLALKHLHSIISYFQTQNLYYLASTSEQNVYNKLTTRLNEVLSTTNFYELSSDEYFTSFLLQTKNYNDRVAVKYLQFWLKRTLREINEGIQAKTNGLVGGFDSYQVQLLYVCYMYSLKYYQMLQVMMDKKTDDEVPQGLRLQALLKDVPQISVQGFIDLSQLTKQIVK